jgi:hypothetical protein
MRLSYKLGRRVLGIMNEQVYAVNKFTNSISNGERPIKWLLMIRDVGDGDITELNAISNCWSDVRNQTRLDGVAINCKIIISYIMKRKTPL